MEAQIQAIITKAIELITAYFAFILIFGSVPYFIKSYGIYQVAKRNNLKYTWFSWIPVMRYHVVSQVADYFRVSVGKEKKITANFEIATLITAALLIGFIVKQIVLLLIPLIILLPILWLNKVFATYYFYKFCDRENATIFFILGLTNGLLNSFFFFNCREKGNRIQYTIYR